MKIDVSRQAVKNIAFGSVHRLFSILIPFLLRTLLIRRLGLEYAGLGGLFTSIMRLLNFTELGIATAIEYCMYRPIADDDYESIREYLTLFRKLYGAIGMVILAGGVLVMPFLPLLIKDEIPRAMNIYLLYALNLAFEVSSYWVWAFKRTVLSSHQRQDILSRIDLFVLIIRTVLQAAVLIFWRNYYLYIAVSIAVRLVGNVVTRYIADREYPGLSSETEITQRSKDEVRARVRPLILSKIGGVIVNSADPIMISIFLGIVVLGKYQNYFLILTAVRSLIGIIESSCIAGLGNKLQLDSMENNYRTYRNLTFIMWAVTVVCCCMMMNLYQPFMTMWLGEEYLLDMGCVLLLCLYLYVIKVMSVGLAYENAAGIWHPDRYRPLLEGLLNLALNVILVRRIGLYGILLSTVISMAFFSLPWLYQNIMKNIFQRGFIKELVMLTGYFLLATGITAADYFICCRIDASTPAGFVLRAVASAAVPSILILVLFARSESLRWTVNKLISIVKRRYMA
ncbi:MAG: hypothetical protein II497_06545 [Lachnospiraceae bacterium]|nr:hypothetical protein [Lachnospiraceae bacterium]